MEKGLFRRQIEKYFSPELPTKQVLFNLTSMAGICGGLITLFLSLLTDMPMTRHIITVTCLVLLLFTARMANEGGNLEAASLVLTVVLSLVLVPIMFIVGGGIAGGVPMWMALGLILTYGLLEGRKRKLMFAAEAAAYTGLLAFAYFRPELVPHYYTRAVTYLEVWQGIFMVSLVVGFVLCWQTRLYQKTMERYAEQNESLNASKEEAENARAEAMAANRAKSRFLANMSHEIRVPINAVLGMDELILRQTKDKEIEQYAINLRESGQNLLNLINDILDFSRLESGKMEIAETDYHLEEILHDAVNMITPKLEKKGLTFRLLSDSHLPSGLHGDSTRVQQVLINLLTNAAKYTNEGSVELYAGYRKIDEDKIELILSVKDTGIGISSENKQKLYDSFQRLEEERNRNIQGSGIGLSIVKQLLDMMHGIIKVDSIYGKGSTFTVEIPQGVHDWSPVGDVMKILDKARKDNEKYKERFKAPQAKILLVDDMPTNFTYIKKLLKPAEIQVDTAQSGRECLSMLQRKRYHLILMDHMMPEMNGIETMSRMRTLVGNRNIGVPVVIVTANSVAGFREECIALGFSDYLSKPIRGIDLENMILKLVPAGIISMIDTPKDDSVSAITSLSREVTVPLNLRLPDVERTIAQDKVPKELRPLSRMVPGLDVEAGIDYSAGDVGLYMERLAEYAANDRSAEIEKFYGAADWDNYRIQMAALKNTSLAIGHIGISEAAKALENAAKEDNPDFLKYGHPAVMEVYKDLLEKIRAFLACKEIDPGSGEPEKGIHRDSLILIVDDDEDCRKAARHALCDSHRIGEATTAKEAFDFIDRETPDLILLNSALNDSLDGFGIMEQMRMDSAWRKIPVVLLTPTGDTAAELRALKLGARDFISKPLVEEIVYKRVKNIIELTNLSSNMNERVESAARIFGERSNAAENLARQVIETLAGTIDAGDKYQKDHAFRVARLAKEIGSRLGCSEGEQQQIYYLGLVYDIGKAAVPKEIMHKSGALSEEEKSIVQRHVLLGEEMLRKVTLEPEFAQAARWHHERFDGMGYPDGIKGQNIPLFARIIAVADSYDSMRSHRAYRNPLSMADVRAEFLKESGHQFDPDIVRVIAKMIEDDPIYAAEIGKTAADIGS
ncbi:MAG: response regulator [Selenomonadaceae bacterium]|nr:response regulator [Selenomonadaceae bacterium]